MQNEILDQDLQVGTTELNPTYAGFWMRVGASLVDVLVFLPLLGLNFYNIYSLKSLPLQLITILAFAAYKPLLEYKYGATLGKMALKIKVVNEDLGEITFAQALVRSIPSLLSHAVSTVSALLLFTNSDFQEASSMIEVSALQTEVMPQAFNYATTAFYLVSCITVAFSANKQGIHDMLAKTYCVQK